MAQNALARPQSVGIIGGGFAGLATGYFLSSRGIRCTVYEKDDRLGGLAACFSVHGAPLEKFYHHLFAHDRAMLALVRELGLGQCLLPRETNTGVFYGGKIWRLSTPLDLLRFSPLSVADRLRLGMLALRARLVRDFRAIEHLTARDWLVRMAGPRVYQVVWEPLLRGKFGRFAEEIAAPWFWSKLKLRGGSRSARQAEELIYIRGGFARVAQALAERICAAGGEVLLRTPVEKIVVRNGRVAGVVASGAERAHDAVVATVAPPLVAQLAPDLPAGFASRLRAVRYLGVVCLVLALKRKLSETYWLNINEPGFPFVGVIEHTNIIPPEEYGGVHLAYVTKYMLPDDRLFALDGRALFEEYLPWLKRIFPDFEERSVCALYCWREKYAQPIVSVGYGELVPPQRTPIAGLFLCNMAQVYPQDRGTNYSVLFAKQVATMLSKEEQ